MTIERLSDNGLGFILFVGFSVSVALKLRTETSSLSDWISVQLVKPDGVLEVYWKLQGAS
jgi:hypothetical protein